MKKIPLSQGLFALVDDEDYEWLSQWKWCAVKRTNSSDFVAIRRGLMADGLNRNKTFYMHREIVHASFGNDVDHENHNTLDNRKNNLRECDHYKNQWNMQKKKTNTSGFIGVYFRSDRNVWIAKIRTKGKRHYLGKFHDKIDAARAYNDAAKRLHGEFAYTNNI